jgi:hypothetical protein
MKIRSAADQVGDPPAEQQKPAEGQHVRVDHPREVGERDVQPPSDRRQRDVDDRRVENDHEVGHCQQHQRPPATINTTRLWGDCCCE